MSTQLYDYYKKYISEYARLNPDRVLAVKQSKRCQAGWLVRNGNKEHCNTWLRERLWRDHREQLLERTFRRLSQKAQDDRFKHRARTLEQVRMNRKTNRGKHRPLCEIRAEQSAKRALREKARVKNIEIQRFLVERKKKRDAAYRERAELLAEWEKKYADILSRGETHRAAEKRRRRALHLRKRDRGMELHLKRIATEPGHCHWCEKFLPNGGEADHVTPVSKGGGDWIYNIVLSCHECNHDKFNIMPNDPKFPVSDQLHIAFV